MNKQTAPWFEVKAAAGQTRAQVYIFGVIVDYKWDEDDVTAKEFIDAIKPLGDFDLRINSPGGSVWAGNAIYNAIRRHPGAVDVYIEGVAASIASVVAMAGRRVHMPANAMMMIHDPWSYAVGSATDLRKAADMLDKAKTGLVAAYQQKTELATDKIEELMSDETWFTAAEAVELGFADDIAEPVQMAAHHDLTRYRNVPRALKNQPPKTEAHLPKGGNTMPTIDSLRKDHPDLVARIEADARQGMIAQADHEQAITAARQGVLDLHAAVYGEEPAAKFKAVVDSGATADMAKALGVDLSAKDDATDQDDGQATDQASRQAILAGLKDSAADPLKGRKAASGEDAERSALAKAIAAGAKTR